VFGSVAVNNKQWKTQVNAHLNASLLLFCLPSIPCWLALMYVYSLPDHYTGTILSMQVC
jgi:hypothetical protein